MSERIHEASRAPRPTTVIEPVRRAVVVRRRVYDATSPDEQAQATRTFTTVTAEPAQSERDESGPPSSINVARALAALRGDELRRVDEIVDADDEKTGTTTKLAGAAPDVSKQALPNARAVPTLVLGKTIALSELARRMGISDRDLPSTLVARGFYALTAKSVLPRETARIIAEMYGWRVEDAPLEKGEPTPAKKVTVRSRMGSKRTKPAGRARVKATKVRPVKKTKAAKTTRAKRSLGR